MLLTLKLPYYFTTIVVLIVALSSFQNSRTDFTAPYLYYFVAREGIFVIERADGTDRQIFASFQLPSPINAAGDGYLVGPGWSPSGQWFVWSHLGSNGIPSRDAYILSRNGTIARHIQQSSPERPTHQQLMVAHLLWHQNHELLLLHLRTYSPDNGEAYIKLYDPEVNEFILEIDIYAVLEQKQNTYDIFWSNDGQYIILWGSRTIDVLDLQGIKIGSIPVNLFQNLMNTTRRALNYIPFIQYGQRNIPSASGEWRIRVETIEGFGVSNVFVVRNDGTMRRDIAGCPIDSQSCYGWLPDLHTESTP
ncbi:MAG: hypothetical protein SGI73_07435 [Chloroflexota bacterium]|nr:hypothetical protein [Chloroflexota bacterium]